MADREHMIAEFVAYCAAHPQERFWQALRNWSGHNFIGASVDKKTWADTFYWHGKRAD